MVIHLKGEEEKNEEKKEEKQKKKKERKSVQWTEDTIDNENMGRLKSNICCIFHKQHGSESDSSDTCTSDDETNGLERDRISKKKHKEVCSKRKGCLHKK